MTFLRFFLFNLVGNVLPILTALIAVPVIAHHAGVDRLGALGVVWGLIGYFGFLDFGLSRVVTRRVALAVEQHRTAEELTELRGFLWWWAVPGLVAIVLLLMAAQSLFGRYFPGGTLGLELNRGWLWIVLCVPVTLMTNWLRGALEGVQRFARVNLLRMIFGAWNYAAPALVVLIWPTLDAMIAVIALGRLLALIAHAVACLKAEPAILLGHAPRRLSSGPLFFQEGGWMTVSNLVAPLMVYADRFVLAALVPASAIAWYVTSQEVMLRALVIPAAMAGALFPKFSGATEVSIRQTVFVLYQRSIRFISAIMSVFCTMAAVLAYDALRLWLGNAFALNSYRIVEIVAAGIYVNAIAHLPFAWLQGVGRSHIAARIHLIQLPLYAAALYFAVLHAGIEGAAWMWTIRVAIDCLSMLLTAGHEGRRSAIWLAVTGGAFILLAGYFTGPEHDWHWRFAVAAAAACAALLLAWFGLLNRADRQEIGKLRHAY